MTRLPLATSTLAALSLIATSLSAGCGGDFDLQRTELQTDTTGNFEIIVSNQSFEIDAVDIRVRIDGKVAISDVFHVEDQHTFVAHPFRVAPGRRTISVETDTGEASLEAVIDVTPQKRWAAIMFWYYPEGTTEPTPRQFSFNESDEQPLFD